MQAVAHEFNLRDLVGGHIALDFANTVTARDTSPRDWLDGYERLVDWARLASLVNDSAANKLRAAAARAPRDAAAALGRARKLREALYAALVALLSGHQASGAVAEIDSAWKRAVARARMTALETSMKPKLELERSGLDLPLDLVVFAAVDLLGRLDSERTRVCRGHDCGWLFVDSSKGGRRVWCDMATCGNASKSARFARTARGRRRADA